MITQVLQYVFAGLAAVFAGWGYVRRPKRSFAWLAAICAGSAAVSARYDAFWPLVSFGVVALWAAFAGTNLVDLSWRVRAGLVASVATIAFIAMWPTFDAMSGGKLKCPQWVKQRVEARLVAGLDLRGGLRLVYTVDVDEAIKDKRDRFYEEMRAELARYYEFHSGDNLPSEEALTSLREKVDVRAPRGSVNKIEFEFKDPADIEKVNQAQGPIDERFRALYRGDFGDPKPDGALVTYTMREAAESQIRERSVAQAKEIILRRVDELGLREATVSSRDEDIIVEVPGEDDKAFQEIRDIISATARLEFKLLDDESGFMDEVEKAARANPETLAEGVEFTKETGVSVGLDEDGEVQQTAVTYAYITKKDDETMTQALERFREWAATLDPPPDRELGFEKTRDIDRDNLKETETGWRTYLLKTRAEITGDLVRDAAAEPVQGSALGGWRVALRFTDQGGSIFERITGANVKRRFAVILDERIESSPVIQTKIPGGSAVITMGSGDPEIQLRDARKLELVLRSGALPAPISPSNEQRIGPTLGADSIRLGVRGALVGVTVVVIFMIIYYLWAGLIADIAVGMNLFFQLAILSSFSASMTLPGIAGLALTVGMSVDANVLVNERIREELRDGKSPRAAVEIGYSKALSAIVDGHATTLISGLILAQYGTGPIKGFAVTLIVGTLTSIFCGIVVSRIFFDVWVRRMKRTGKLQMG